MQNSFPSGSAKTLVLAPTLDRFQIQIQAVLHRLHFRDLDEQQPVRPVAAQNEAFFVTRHVRVTFDVDVVQYRLLPLGELVRVAAVDRGVRDA